MSADALLAMVTVVILSMLRFGSDRWMGSWRTAGVDPLILLLGYAIGWVAMVSVNNLYRLRARWSIRREALDIVQAGALYAVLIFSLLFILKLPGVSRLFLLYLFPAQVIVTFLYRLGLRRAFAWARGRGLNTRYVLLIGDSPTAWAFADRIERHRDLGLRVIGALRLTESAGTVPDDEGVPRRGSGMHRPVLGSIEDIEEILHQRIVDEVVVALPPAAWNLVEPLARICQEEGKVVRVPLLEGTFSLPGAREEDFDGTTVLSLVYGPDRALSLLLKRVLDLAGASLALMLLSPGLALVSLIITMRDGRPILFLQDRVGLHGRVFRVFKFRTMVVDAEAQLETLLELNEISGHAFKLTDDPRQSRTGRWLRRTSVDELPQLLNVLRGEMSLVGPRPPLPREVAAYDLWHRRRLSMKPGITGLWQVAARGEDEFDRWVEMDLDYIDRWSLWLDIKIMVRTIPAMLQGR